MTPAFITIRFLDIIDIFLVAFLLYQIYMLIKGTAAMNIFAALFFLYIVWKAVVALNMELLGSILGQLLGVGVIAILIVFQQEIRRFLLFIGSKYLSKNKFSLDRLINIQFTPVTNKYKQIIPSLSLACDNMSKTLTGALIVITRQNDLRVYAETGDILNADVSERLLENIFFKNSPLHDGAVIVKGSKVHAARCVLPVTDNPNLPAHYGMRHRAAVGITEETDALVISVSEETGKISVIENGGIQTNLSSSDLERILNEKL